jgi:hypothetical protein
LVCGVLHHLVSLVWIHKRNGLDGVASNYFSFMYDLVWFWGGSQTIGSLTTEYQIWWCVTSVGTKNSTGVSTGMYKIYTCVDNAGTRIRYLYVKIIFWHITANTITTTEWMIKRSD